MAGTRYKSVVIISLMEYFKWQIIVIISVPIRSFKPNGFKNMKRHTSRRCDW